MTEEGYNGYANYETWLLCLNVDNDYGLYTSVNELVTEYLNETHHDRDTADKYDLGERIKEFLEEIYSNDELGIVKICDTWTWRDWQEIDWQEVAETRLSD
jgi:hypothetical protein